jgi:hypothetical protein
LHQRVKVRKVDPDVVRKLLVIAASALVYELAKAFTKVMPVLTLKERLAPKV